MNGPGIRRLVRDVRGGAAVEFALVAPLLAAVVAMLVVVWGDLTAAARMRSAVHAGAVYVRAGGSDTDLVRTVVERSWEEMPNGSDITVTESCTCGGVVAAGGCAVLCPSGLPPSVYVRIDAETGDADQVVGRSIGEVIRVR